MDVWSVKGKRILLLMVYEIWIITIPALEVNLLAGEWAVIRRENHIITSGKKYFDFSRWCKQGVMYKVIKFCFPVVSGQEI
jgi:hypothetical protein